MLTEKKFNGIWFMIKGGAPDDVIISSQEISEGTLNRVKKSNGDYAKYRKLHSEEVMSNNHRRKKSNDDEKRPPTQTITVQASYYMNEELKNMNKTLTLISNKLTNIMENMESMKEAWK